MSFERGLERFIEKIFSGIFRSNLQPLELSRRIGREMDLQRSVGVNGLIAPNVFRVALAVPDYERLATVGNRLQNELAEAARLHAKDSSYIFMGPVSVYLEKDASLRTGQFMVAVQMDEREDETLTGTLEMPDSTRIDIGIDAVVIGRSSDCAVVLADSNASRRHAEVRREGTTFVITDLGSTNGTKVNGINVKERRLVDGDRITIGATSIKFLSTQGVTTRGSTS